MNRRPLDRSDPNQSIAASNAAPRTAAADHDGTATVRDRAIDHPAMLRSRDWHPGMARDRHLVWAR